MKRQRRTTRSSYLTRYMAADGSVRTVLRTRVEAIAARTAQRDLFDITGFDADHNTTEETTR